MVNYQKVRTKITELFTNVNINYIDIIVFSETKRNHDIYRGELKLHQFNIFPCDSSQSTSMKKGGGEVLIATHKSPLKYP